MKKSLVIRNSLAAALIAASFWSCAQQDSYLSAVPADTQFAIKINPGVIFDKTALAENAQFKSLMMTVNGLIGMSITDQNMKDAALAVIENPESATGMDFSKPIVFAASDFGNVQTIADSAKVFAIIPLNDADRLGNALAAVHAEVYPAENGYTLGCYSNSGMSFSFGFNDKALVIDPVPFTDAAKETDKKAFLAGLLSQKNVTVANRFFDEFVKCSSDFALWMDYGIYFDFLASVPNIDDNAADAVMETMSDMLDGAALMISSNAGQGNITFRADVYTNKPYPSASESPEQLFKYLPSNSSIAMAFKFNKNVMIKQYNTLFDGESQEEYEELIETMGITTEQFFDMMAAGFAGSISLSDGGKPEFTIVAAGLTDSLCNQFASSLNISCDNIDVTTDGVYGIISSKGMANDGNFGSTRLAGMIKDGGLAVDFKAIDLSELEESGSNGMNIAGKLLSMLDYAKAYDDNGNSMILDIVFDDKNANALETIANFVLNIK